MKLCRCPPGVIRSDCPFTYANGWHVQRAEMLIRSEITPDVLAAVVKLREKLTQDEIDQL